jgi:hypothetical protein
MPEGKAAFSRCVQLTAENRCLLFGRPERPAVCASLRAGEEMCGTADEEAFARLTRLENLTRPWRAAGAARARPAGLPGQDGSR